MDENFKQLDNRQSQVGGLFGFGERDTFTKAIKRTKHSESKFIDAYYTMNKILKNYTDAYEEHIKNLETIDDFANFKGMALLFKKIIMKDNLKKIR